MYYLAFENFQKNIHTHVLIWSEWQQLRIKTRQFGCTWVCLGCSCILPCFMYTYHCPESNMYYITFFQILHLHNMQNGVTVDRKKCFIFVRAEGVTYLLHNITLAYEHLCKKQMMTPSIVHTYIDWFLPLQMFERHILMVRKIVLLFCNFCIIFDFFCRAWKVLFKYSLGNKSFLHFLFGLNKGRFGYPLLSWEIILRIRREYGPASWVRIQHPWRWQSSSSHVQCR